MFFPKLIHYLKIFAKQILLFIICGIFGIISSMIIFFKLILPGVVEKTGLGFIALLPVLIILYSILGFVFGGILGMVIYNLIMFIQKKKLEKKIRKKY